MQASEDNTKAQQTYAIYMEGVEQVKVGTREKIEEYLNSTLGNGLMLITWHEDCITVMMEPNCICSDIPIVTIEVL